MSPFVFRGWNGEGDDYDESSGVGPIGSDPIRGGETAPPARGGDTIGAGRSAGQATGEALP